ncbi:MAG TPA: hypothetical protein PLE54_05175 [Burkholderiaceae bacterium]|nr:hypothetical protein [Burkholderiaceae bacterium]HQR69973.1 hypothetical protein [Burkholderiaceae bacterium]
MSAPSRPRYQHRQGGAFMRLTFLLGFLMLPVIHALDPKTGPALLIAAPLLALTFVAFDGLTVSVTTDEVTWRFGHLGFPRGQVKLADITEVSVTRTSFWEGWGIRWTRRGMLYNVSGFDAVLLRRRGGKPVLLGTDEPRRLKAAIDAAIQNQGARP